VCHFIAADILIIAILVESQWKERAVNGLLQGGSMWDVGAWANYLGVSL